VYPTASKAFIDAKAASASAIKSLLAKTSTKNANRNEAPDEWRGC
jgi:hypothetical protein